MAKTSGLITTPRGMRSHRSESASVSTPAHSPWLFATANSESSTVSQPSTSIATMEPSSQATASPTMNSSSTASHLTEDARARAAGLYPYGPSIFATLPPLTLPDGAAFTFSPSSLSSPGSAGSAAGQPVFSGPTGVTSFTPRVNETNTPRLQPQPSAPLAALSAQSPYISAPPAEDLARDTSQEQAVTAPATAASQSAAFTTDVMRIVNTPFILPNTSGPASGVTLSSLDCSASTLIKHLQDQIQLLKQKTVLEGLLSHLTIPDVDSLKNENKCHVCLETFLTGTNPELPIKLQCGHICGSICIIRWLAPQRTRPVDKNCPICRRPIFGIECASEWNALTSLEATSLGIKEKLEAMLTHVLSRGVTLPNPLQTDIPVTWGKGQYLQAEPGYDDLQWEAWRRFLEELVVHVESANEWSLWYHQQQLVVPIVSMITVFTFMEMKNKGNVWISRVIIELPELYLPLSPFLDRAYPDYVLAVPREELYRKTADLHARIEKKGHCLWSCLRPCSTVP